MNQRDGIYLRREKPEDFDGISTLLKAAFKDDLHSDQTEHLLVERLRKSPFYIPKLAIVAETNNQIIGYILLTKISIVQGEKEFEVLALAPVAVLPAFQNIGLGSGLIHFAHGEAKKMGYKAIALIGHEKYYPRFGYKMAKEFGIEFWECSAKNNINVEESFIGIGRAVKDRLVADGLGGPAPGNKLNLKPGNATPQQKKCC